MKYEFTEEAKEVFREIRKLNRILEKVDAALAEETDPERFLRQKKKAEKDMINRFCLIGVLMDNIVDNDIAVFEEEKEEAKNV